MDEDEISKALSQRVYAHNDLIQRGRFELTEQEQNIIMYLVSHIKKEDMELDKHTFPMEDFFHLCGSTGEGGAPYAHLKKTLKNFADKSAWVVHPDKSEELVRMLDTIRLYPNSRTLTIGLHREMKPYLIQLQKDYTPFELYWVIAMKSKYSKRLYQVLKSHEWKKSQVRFSVDELKKQLFAENWKGFGQFRQKVLDIALRDINELSDIKVELVKIEKEGKRYAWLTFSIKSKNGTEKIQAIGSNEHRKDSGHIRGQGPIGRPGDLDEDDDEFEEISWSEAGAPEIGRLAEQTATVPRDYAECNTWEEVLAVNERKGNKYVTAFYRASKFGVPIPRGTAIPKGIGQRLDLKWRD